VLLIISNLYFWCECDFFFFSVFFDHDCSVRKSLVCAYVCVNILSHISRVAQPGLLYAHFPRSHRGACTVERFPLYCSLRARSFSKLGSRFLPSPVSSAPLRASAVTTLPVRRCFLTLPPKPALVHGADSARFCVPHPRGCCAARRAGGCGFAARL